MTARPRVLIVGGIDVHFRIDMMRRLADEFELSALGSNPELAPRFAEAGFDYACYQLSARANPLLDLKGLLQQRRLMRRIRPQIVHTFATKPGVWGRLAARLADVPVIIGTLPGLGSLYASQGLKTRLMRGVYQPLQRLACNVSQVTVFQNKADLREFVQAGVVDSRAARLIPGSGIDTGSYRRESVSTDERARVRQELGITPEERVATMITRVNRTKGVLDLAAAAELLRQRTSGVRVLLIGPRDEGVDRLGDQDLERLRSSLDWPGPRRDVAAVLAASDVFVFPSTYREGVPRALLEAAAMELPLIATDTPGCQDVVLHEQTGLLVPCRDPQALAEATLRLLEDTELRRRLARAARRHVVEHYDVEVVIRQTRELYRELLGCSSR